MDGNIDNIGEIMIENEQIIEPNKMVKSDKYGGSRQTSSQNPNRRQG